MSGIDRLLFLCFFLSGASGLVYEVVWLRWLVHLFGATSLAVSTVLTAFMAGLALGSWAAGRRAQRIRRPLVVYGLLELAIGTYALLLPVALRAVVPALRVVGADEASSYVALSLGRFVLATLSNGNIALIVNMARHGGLPWDAVLSAEVAKHYKPQRECYLTTAALLGLRPQECLMVAAHNNDLDAAAGCGLRTAFVPRPTEHGAGQTRDVSPSKPWDVVAKDFVDLAVKLGC